MPVSSNYRLPAASIEADREALLALKDFDDFAPVNPAHSAAALSALDQALRQADENELRAHKALAAARDAAINAGWALHNAMTGAKAQVVAQYGNDSLAVQAIGMKKRSDRKRPNRRGSAMQKEG